MSITRRRFLAAGVGTAATVSVMPTSFGCLTASKPNMSLGLVTYQWGKDWDLPTIIRNCEKTGILGVELRTQHKHGVEPSLSDSARAEVRKRFEDSPVKMVGYGSNAQFHDPDAAKLKHNIDLTKAYVKLMHDCGGSGVKVKPNRLPDDVPHSKTIEQIGEALNEVAKYGAEYNQKIRLEVHGKKTDELPIIRAIMKIATHPNVGVCWNCNETDLKGRGIQYNFDLVKDRLADTVHVRELNVGNYPYPQLMRMLTKIDYRGWILLECRTQPSDYLSALREQKSVFEKLVEGGR